MSDRHLRRISAACAAVLLLATGVVLGALELPPGEAVRRAAAFLQMLDRNFEAYAGIKPNSQLEPLRFAGRAPRIDAEAAAPGVTLITGLFGDSLKARLYDRSGSLLYEWPVDLFDLFRDQVSYRFGSELHGDYLYPNGDVLIINQEHGIARIDACGKLIWKREINVHHSIDIDEEGFIWTPGGAQYYARPGVLYGASFRLDQILKLDPNSGETVDAIDLIDMLAADGLEGLIQANRPRLIDTMHVNDVEILKRSMAGAYPMFRAGDILLSGRHNNQIWVIDGKTRRLKWWRTGPMHGQHDPDFGPDGAITLLDNRPGSKATPANGFRGNSGGSRIIALRPDSLDYRVIYKSDERNNFYTPYRGKHQRLANGDLLITETDAGRVFEVTPDGRVVWEVIAHYDEDEVGWLTGGTRYPDSYGAAVLQHNCEAEAS